MSSRNVKTVNASQQSQVALALARTPPSTLLFQYFTCQKAKAPESAKPDQKHPDVPVRAPGPITADRAVASTIAMTLIYATPAPLSTPDAKKVQIKPNPASKPDNNAQE